MAVRNIMVMFSSNVGQYARDMAAAAAATDKVAVAGQRLDLVKQKNALSGANYSEAQAAGVSSQVAAEKELNRLAQERNNLGAQAAKQAQAEKLFTAQGEKGEKGLSTLQDNIALNKAAQVANNEAAIAVHQASQDEIRDLQKKNLAYQQSNQQVINGTKSEINALESANNAKRDLINKASKDAVLVGAAGIAAIAGTVVMAAKFENEMSKAAAISDYTSQHLKGMSDAILRIGSVTPVPLEELTKGLVSAEQAGFQGAQALGLVKLGAEGAVVGMTDASTAISGISTVLTGFSLGIGQATNVNNILIAAVQHGLGTYSSFAEALTQVGPAAKAAGIDINTTAAAIAVMTRKGLDATTAATGIGRILVQLARQGTPAERTLTDFANATTHMNYANGEAVIKGQGLIGTLKLIGSATEGSLTKLEQFIPNIRQIRASLALLDNGGSDVVAMVRLFSSSTNLAVEAAKAYAARLDTTSSQFQLMKNNINEAGIAIGQDFLPIANKLIEWVTNLATEFANMAPWAKTAIEVIVGGGSALLVVGGIVGLVSKSLGNLGSAWGSLTKILKTDVAANNEAIAADKAKIQTLEELNATLRQEYEALQQAYEMEQAAIDQHTASIAALNGMTGSIVDQTAALDLNTEARLRNITTPLAPGTPPPATTIPGEEGAPTVVSPTAAAPAGSESSLIATTPAEVAGAETVGAEGAVALGGAALLPELENGPGIFSRAGSLIAGHPMLAGGAGLAASFGAFQLQHALGDKTAGGKVANVFGDVSGFAGAGAIAGNLIPIPGVGPGVGAVVGGGIGLAKGLWNAAQGSTPAGPDKEWSDAIQQQQQGVGGSVQQKFFNDLATSNAGPGKAIDNFTKMGVSIQGVSDILNGGIKSTDASKQVYGDWAKSLGITTDQLEKVGVSSKDAAKYQDDLKKALGGDSGAAGDLKDKLKTLQYQSETYAGATGKVSDQQMMSADTLKVVSKEIDKHSAALADNKKKQQDLLPATQATNAMMAAMGTNADGTAVDLAKVPPQVKAVVDAFNGMIDPTKAFAAAAKDPINIALQGTSDFASFSDVFDAAQKKAQSALDDTASAAAKSANKASSDQIAATKASVRFTLDEQKRGIGESEALSKAALSGFGGSGLSGKLVSAQLSAGAADAKAALDKQYYAQLHVASGASVTAKQIKESYGNGGVAQVSLREFESEMVQSIAEQNAWDANLKKIAQRAKDSKIDVSDLLAGLEKKGKPAEAIASGLASGSIQDIAVLAAQSKSLANTGKPVVSADEFKTDYQKQLDNANKFKNDLMKVASATGGTQGLVAQMFLSKKDDPAAQAALHDLATHLTPAAVAAWEKMADEAASGFGQEAAIKFSKQTDIVQTAIQTLQDTSGAKIKTAAGKMDFWKTVATTAGVDQKTAETWVKNNIDVIMRAVGGSTGLSVDDWKKLLGTGKVKDALAADGGIAGQIKKDAEKTLLKPYKAKVDGDTTALNKAVKQYWSDLKAHPGQPILLQMDMDKYNTAKKQVDADKAHMDKVRMNPEIELKDKGYLDDITAAQKAFDQLKRDTEGGASRTKITADKTDYDKKIGQVKKDEADFKGGDLTKLVISADTTKVDAAFRTLQNEKKRGHDPVQYQIDLKAWNTAKTQLTNDQQTLHDKGNKPVQPKVVLDGLPKFKQDVQTAITERDKIGGTVKVVVTPNKQTGKSAGSSSTSSSGTSSSETGPGSSRFVSPSTPQNPNPVGHWEGSGKNAVFVRGAAFGGFLHFADGGMLSALPGQAHIRKAGTAIQWAEPETGGEAFIPMSMAKRSRSLGILTEVARNFGVGVTKYADGGLTRPMGIGMLGQQRVMSEAPRVVVVQHRTRESQQQHFNFGDIQGPSMKDVQRFAEQKARMKSFRGDG